MILIEKQRGFLSDTYDKDLSKEMTVFQTFRLQKEMFRNMPFYSIPKRMRARTYTVKYDDRLSLVFPVLEGKNKIEIAGETQGTSYLMPIYFSDSEKLFDVCFGRLLDYLSDKGITEVKLLKIPENCRTYRFVENSLSGWKVQKKPYENVKIILPKSYDEWFASLSKSVRQNIRTAYNRLSSDSCNYKAEMFRGGEIPASTMRKMVGVYNNRHISRYGVKTTLLKKFYLQYIDFCTRDMKNNPDALHFVLTVNGEIASFFSGYIDKNTESVIVLRLSINQKYSRYSPGYVLLNEAIKSFFQNSTVKCVDLTAGTEKYKLDLGGTVYMKYTLHLTKAN